MKKRLGPDTSSFRKLREEDLEGKTVLLKIISAAQVLKPGPKFISMP